MRKAVPLSPALIQAACDLHAKLVPWHRSDEALLAVKAGIPGFSAAAVLAKATLVNALYFTNVYAIVRVAEHFAGVLAETDPRAAGPELVVALANVPRGGTEKRNVRRLSLAAKFSHFFVDEDRFPIYDRYAVRMLSRHVGVPMSRLDGKYIAFVAAFDSLAAATGVVEQRRRLDRYLWIHGQYEDWRRKGKASSGDLEAAFKRGDWPPSNDHVHRRNR